MPMVFQAILMGRYMTNILTNNLLDVAIMKKDSLNKVCPCIIFDCCIQSSYNYNEKGKGPNDTLDEDLQYVVQRVLSTNY